MDEVIEAIEKYQGLVPLVYDIETMVLDEARQQDMPYAVYLKREADKVIAHHKYKRCLAMAKWCDAMKSYFNESAFFDVYSNERMVFYERWHNRWFKIVEQFKEAK